MPLQPMTAEELGRMREKAAQAKRDKAAALAELKAGTLGIVAVLAGHEPRLAKTKVRRVLTQLPGIGDVRAGKLMATAGIHEARRVRGLTPRQRNDLAGLLT